jgi:hypothetical protein
VNEVLALPGERIFAVVFSGVGAHERETLLARTAADKPRTPVGMMG